MRTGYALSPYMTRFRLRPSRCLLLTFIAAHAAAAVVIVPLQISIAGKTAFWILVGVSFACVLVRHVFLRTSDAIVAGVLVDASRAKLTCRNGREFEAEVLGTTYVSPTITAINLRAGNSRLARHVLLVPDNVDSEDFRSLRVCLRWAPRVDSADADATQPLGFDR